MRNEGPTDNIKFESGPMAMYLSAYGGVVDLCELMRSSEESIQGDMIIIMKIFFFAKRMLFCAVSYLCVSIMQYCVCVDGCVTAANFICRHKKFN